MAKTSLANGDGIGEEQRVGEHRSSQGTDAHKVGGYTRPKLEKSDRKEMVRNGRGKVEGRLHEVHKPLSVS